MIHALPITDRAAMVAILKHELSQRLAALKAPLAAHQAAAEALRHLGLDAGHINAVTAFHKMATRFLQDLDKRLTANHQGLGFAQINLQSAEHDFECRRFRHAGAIQQGAEFDDLVRRLVEYYPFEALADEAIRQSKQLEAKGLADIAYQLGSDLGLFVGFCNRDSPYLPVRGGRFGCNFRLQKSIMGDRYCHTVAARLDQMARNMATVELEVGVQGMAQSVVNISGFLTGPLLASRTKVNTGRPIEAVVFNDHMHLRFTPELADALLAFVAMHNARDVELVGLQGTEA